MRTHRPEQRARSRWRRGSRCRRRLPHRRPAAPTLRIKSQANSSCYGLEAQILVVAEIPAEYHDTGVRHGGLPRKPSTEHWILSFLPANLFLAWVYAPSGSAGCGPHVV